MLKGICGMAGDEGESENRTSFYVVSTATSVCPVYSSLVHPFTRLQLDD